MLIISVRDDGNNRWKRKEKNKKQKGKNGGASYSEIVRAKSFCWAFKLGFFQLICKAPLIFKPNLELTLSIILKERIISVKACFGGV